MLKHFICKIEYHPYPPFLNLKYSTKRYLYMLGPWKWNKLTVENWKKKRCAPSGRRVVARPKKNFATALASPSGCLAGGSEKMFLIFSWTVFVFRLDELFLTVSGWTCWTVCCDVLPGWNTTSYALLLYGFRYEPCRFFHVIVAYHRCSRPPHLRTVSAMVLLASCCKTHLCQRFWRRSLRFTRICVEWFLFKSFRVASVIWSLWHRFPMICFVFAGFLKVYVLCFSQSNFCQLFFAKKFEDKTYGLQSVEKQVQRRQQFHVDQKGESLFDFDGSRNIDCESTAFPSFRSEKYSTRGTRKVATGMTGLWQPNVHSDVAFWSFDVVSNGCAWPIWASKEADHFSYSAFTGYHVIKGALSFIAAQIFIMGFGICVIHTHSLPLRESHTVSESEPSTTA